MTECAVYRCSRQDEMYLYLRADLAPDALPEALRRAAGRLTRVMSLRLTPDRKLARVDVLQVIEQLKAPGYYLQLPPDGHIQPHLDDGD